MGKVSSKLLMNLVEDILDLEKFDAGTFTHIIEPFQLSELVEDIKFIFEAQWWERGLHFRIDADERILEKFYESDHGRIRQVLINLISNAVKFTQEGGITIQIEERCMKHAFYLGFSVIDTGVGISKKDQRNLFKMFGMIKKQRNVLNQHGTGIGLVISKQIVESLNGKIHSNHFSY